jgi:hypothetical protein
VASGFSRKNSRGSGNARHPTVLSSGRFVTASRNSVTAPVTPRAQARQNDAKGRRDVRARRRTDAPPMPATMRPLLVTLGLLLAMPTGAAEPRPARVLFIGNSLTVANNLPAMIEAAAASVGLKGAVTCRGVAYDNFGLPEHWEHGEALRGIERGGWTHVVLQQGPSSLPESQRILREYAKKFAFEARARGAKVILYGVWPARGRLAALDAVTASYAAAARDVGGSLVAVGEGWRAAWRRDPSLPLYGPDQFHPSPLGSYLGALMFLEHLTGRAADVPNPTGSTERALKDLRIDASQFEVLKAAAAEAAALGAPQLERR